MADFFEQHLANIAAGTQRIIDASYRRYSAICALHEHAEPVCAACCYTDNGRCDCACHDLT